jgi:hypothetical protein
MTQYEARFYYQSENIIYPIGRYGGKSDYTKMQIMSDQCGQFINSLYDQLFQSFNFNGIKLKINDESKYVIYFNTDYNNNLIIYLWVGDKNPVMSIISSEYNTKALRNNATKVSISGWDYKLSHSACFFNKTPTYFIELLNKYRSECSEEDINNFISGNYYLRFMSYQDHYSEFPLAIGYLRNINEALPEHKNILLTCPEGQLPCESNALNIGFFVFINKEKWISKDIFTINDINWLKL